MVTGGNATVFISDLEKALAFYTGVLGMKVVSHYGNDWATVEAGGFTVGLHPRDPKQPDPGTHGAIMIGLNVDDIDVARMRAVSGGALKTGPVVRGSGGAFVHFHDLDGNALYFWSI